MTFSDSTITFVMACCDVLLFCTIAFSAALTTCFRDCSALVTTVCIDHCVFLSVSLLISMDFVVTSVIDAVALSTTCLIDLTTLSMSDDCVSEAKLSEVMHCMSSSRISCSFWAKLVAIICARRSNRCTQRIDKR